MPRENSPDRYARGLSEAYSRIAQLKSFDSGRYGDGTLHRHVHTQQKPPGACQPTLIRARTWVCELGA